MKPQYPTQFQKIIHLHHKISIIIEYYEIQLFFKITQALYKVDEAILNVIGTEEYFTEN